MDGGNAYELNLAKLREFDVFRKESISGVDSLCAGPLRNLKDLVLPDDKRITNTTSS